MTNWRYLLSMGDLSAKEMAYELSQNTDNAKCRFCEFAFEYEKCPGTAEPEVCEEHIYRWLRRRGMSSREKLDSSEGGKMTNYPEITLPGENWVKIKDFPGYLVSDYGRVWSSKSLRLVALNETHFCSAAGGKGKPVYTERGYLAVAITHKSGKQRHMRVHRLVASHFVLNPDPENNNVVDHIDNDPFNNMAANLRWVTSRANLHAAATDETQKYTRWLKQHLEAREAAND